jgi:hypothetical protein
MDNSHHANSTQVILIFQCLSLAMAAMLKQQGVNVKGLLKAAPVKEEVPELLNSSGKLQVWKVDGNVKSDVPLVDVGKFYDNSCYIVLYTYQGDKSDRKEEYLLCYWLGQQASLEDKAAAATLTNEIYLSLKERPVQVFFFPQPLMLQFCSPTLVRICSEVQEFPN